MPLPAIPGVIALVIAALVIFVIFRFVARRH